MSQPTREIGVWLPNAGDRIRLLVEYQNSLRPMLWFEVEKDGSIYIAPRQKNFTELRAGSVKSKDGKAAVNVEEWQPITDKTKLESAKVSFHASGVTNSFDRRSFRSSIRSIQEQEELCYVCFHHPKHYSKISKVRHRDICLRYPIDENSALCANFYVAPIGATKIMQVAGASFQLNLFFDYSDLAGIKPIRLQVVLYHGTSKTWPKWTLLAYSVRS